MTKRSKFLVFLFIFPLPFLLYAQQPVYILQGYTISQHNKETIQQAKVFIPRLGKSIVTDKEGHFTIAIPAGSYFIEISHPYYQSKTFAINLTTDTITDFRLKALGNSQLLQEVEVIRKKVDRVNTVASGKEKITVNELNSLPFVGDRDIVKTLSLLPGIQQANEGSAQLYVRGGTPDQNLLLLDDVPLYNSSHLLGFYSSINPFLVKDATVHKSFFPSRFDGRISSVIEISSIDTIPDRFTMDADLGVLSSRVMAQVPLIENKSSLIVAGRRSYLDLFSKFSSNPASEANNFHDLFIKYQYKPDDKNAISTSFFADRDKFYYKTYLENTAIRLAEEQIRNRQWFANVQWKTTFNEKINSNISLRANNRNLYVGSYRENTAGEVQYDDAFSSTIRDYSFKGQLNYFYSNRLSINAGTEATWHHFKPSEYKSLNTGETQWINTQPELDTYEMGAWLESTYEDGRNLVQAGLRNNYYLTKDKTWAAVNYRLFLQRTLSAGSAINISASRNWQPVQMLYNPGLGLPYDIWVSSTERVRPQVSKQLSLGFTKDLQINSKAFNLNIETYYRRLNQVISLKDGYHTNDFITYSYLNNRPWEDIVSVGNGNVYGVDFKLEKQSGKLRGWVGYTLSWNKLKFEDLNQGKSFWADHDRRHQLTLALTYPINEKWELGASWVYSTGRPITVPEYAYTGVGIDYSKNDLDPFLNTIYYGNGSRNTYRIKANHRLDLSIKKNFQTKWASGSFNLGIYNTYNRRNPFFQYIDSDGTANSRRYVVKSVSFFPIIPSFSVTLRF